jgi:hypothetical protein
MTREDIIRMAREAKWGISKGRWLIPTEELERFAALVIAHREAQSIHTCGPDCQKPLCVNRRREIEAAVEAEREACAKIADSQIKNLAVLTVYPGKSAAAWDIANAIRARGSK